MNNSNSKRLHDLMAEERQREELRWLCPNCRIEISSYVNKCSYCSAQIHVEEHLTGGENPQAIERLIEKEHYAEGGKAKCPQCHHVIDSHVYKCPHCGAHPAGISTEYATNRYLAMMNIPLIAVWLLVGIILGILVWNIF